MQKRCQNDKRPKKANTFLKNANNAKMPKPEKPR